MVASKVIATDKNIFSVGIKVTIIASIDVILICLQVTPEEPEVITPRASVKKVFLKILRKSQKNISLFFCKFCEIFKKTYFGNVCERLLLRVRSLRVSFRKVSGFYCVDNCFIYISCKFPVNLFFLRMSQQTKTCSKNDKKRQQRTASFNVIRVSL